MLLKTKEVFRENVLGEKQEFQIDQLTYAQIRNTPMKYNKISKLQVNGINMLYPRKKHLKAWNLLWLPKNPTSSLKEYRKFLNYTTLLFSNNSPTKLWYASKEKRVIAKRKNVDLKRRDRDYCLALSESREKDIEFKGWYWILLPRLQQGSSGRSNP